MAYFKAVTLDEAPSAPTSAPPTTTPTTLAGRINKLVSDEFRISADVIVLSKQFNTSQNAVQEAVKQLQEKSFVKIELDGLKPFLVSAKSG